MKKKIKHKWWKHLIFKYKVVETDTAYHEYERFRYWVVIVFIILALIFSPIIVASFIFTDDLKNWFHFEDGKDGRTESYTIYKKEEINHE